MNAQMNLFEVDPVSMMKNNRDKFTDDFMIWLPKNLHIWKGFVEQSFKIIEVGFKHYSARTIIEVLRHHTALQQTSGGDWKIGNNAVPYLARLFDLVYPQHAGLFEYRETKAVKT